MSFKLFILFYLVGGLPFLGLWVCHLFLSRQIICDAHGSPYLVRYFIWKPDGLKRRIYLHHILRSDHDRAVHGHPWAFTSIILWNGYWEHSNINEFGETQTTEWFRAGDVLRRKSDWKHRLEINPGETTWSLVFTGPRVQEWGFYPNGKFCHWKKYDISTGLCEED
jgi:hypothetical protein